LRPKDYYLDITNEELFNLSGKEFIALEVTREEAIELWGVKEFDTNGK
jgi:hypothetical protein